MKIVRVVCPIEGGSVHVELDEVLPAGAKLFDVIEADGQRFVLTGVRSPPSNFATIRPVTEVG